jgi:hypothetical protein
MEEQAIQNALGEIAAESDPTLKSQRMASLVSEVFRTVGVELVVVGGSAIEFYTEGAYASGDLDLCLVPPSTLTIRQRQELMGRLGAEGGPRSWRVAGMFVDVLGECEYFANTQRQLMNGPYGVIQIVQPEDLLVERILVSAYPGPNEEARACARKLIGVAIANQLEMDWAELRRLAELPEYDNLADCEQLIAETCNELGKENPLHS